MGKEVDKKITDDDEGDLVDELETGYSHLDRSTSIDDYPREVDLNKVGIHSTLDSVKKEVAELKKMESYCKRNGIEEGVLIENIKSKNVLEVVKQIVGGKLLLFGHGDTMFDPRDYTLKSR